MKIGFSLAPTTHTLLKQASLVPLRVVMLVYNYFEPMLADPKWLYSYKYASVYKKFLQTATV